MATAIHSFTKKSAANKGDTFRMNDIHLSVWLCSFPQNKYSAF